MKVLLATDGSMQADLAEAYLAKLPFSHMEITVAMVAHTPAVLASPFTMGMETVAGDCFRLQVDISAKTVEQVCDRLSEAGYWAKPLVLQGDTANELLDEALRGGYDLVAAGTHVASGSKAMGLGSVGRKLALYAGCSVLLARPLRTGGHAGSSARVRSKSKLDVLVAADGSAGSELALKSLSELTEPRFSRLSVLSVAPFGEEDREGPAENVGLAGRDELRASEIACSVGARLAKCADEVRPYVGVGRASEAIVRCADHHDVDLVMLGANRHGLVERLLLGSCAYETATRAHCPVLIARGGLEFG